VDTYELRPIGFVRSPLQDKADAPRQGDEGAPAAKIEILPDMRDALDGVAVGDELVVLTWLHLADRGVLKVHPRDDLSRPLTGVFATRSSDRPNPVGLHRVTVVGLSADAVEVGPLEAIDGTPVVDLKPVLRPSR
jgi:tRNA-Thr(GGU) m(6)t(6)A37 methyltransferase TsaA